MTLEVDHVVVGAGSAGCIVAARLADAGRSVVLLEAGGSDDKFLIKRAGMVAAIHATMPVKKTVDWMYYSVPQRHARDRTVPMNRGKLVGGSGSVNGMLWVRGHRSNYDDWAAEGNTGWDADAVNDVYRRMEDFEDGADAYRGAGGPVPVRRHGRPSPASVAMIDAASDALDLEVVDDYNGAEQEGVSRFQANISDGVRRSSARTYLHAKERPNLTLVTGATVSRIVVEGGRAVGVEYLDRRGQRQVVRSTADVVVSAGAFGSPQVLMLSGIGPADHLGGLGIDVVADLPVGDNLHDHLFVPVTAHADVPTRGTARFFGTQVAKDLLGRETLLRHPLFETVAFARSSLAGTAPDVQLHQLPFSYPSPNSDDITDLERDSAPSITTLSTLIYPKSRGTVRLATTDPTAAPLIDPNYLAEPDDVEVLAQGIEMIREVMSTSAMARFAEPELHPGLAISGATLRDEIRNRATTVYHPVGSCRMGVDERAVVDPRLRVVGIENLRVADASIMPSITGGNTNAPSMMIGERAADLVLDA